MYFAKIHQAEKTRAVTKQAYKDNYNTIHFHSTQNTILRTRFTGKQNLMEKDRMWEKIK